MKTPRTFVIALQETRQVHQITPTELELPPDLAGHRGVYRQPRQSLFSILLLLASWLCLLFSADVVMGQGALTNGWMHTGTIAPVGDSDSWTFSANAGDRIVLRVGKISQTNTFTPRLRLLNPSAGLQASTSGSVAAEIAVTATNSGTFTVIVDDLNGTLATGTYRLTLAKSPGAVFVAPGDEGGPMTNDVMHTGTIDVGDLDVWTFNANAGDAIVVRMGEITDTSGNFEPWVRLYSPDGTLLDSSFNLSVCEAMATATNSGTFTVVVGDGNGALSGTGTYRLTLAKTGDPVVVSPGDEGGPMTNGVMHTGTITTGDLDLWTFSANTGDAIVLRVGNATNTSGNFEPWIRLYSPLGKLLGSGFGTSAGEVAVNATNTGTFIVVLGDGNGALSGTGTYRLTLAKTGDPVVVSPGDEGGPMTNGVMHTGTITTGDLDLWTFNANSGDAIVLRVGNATNTSGNFEPWIRLYSPLGKQLGSGFGTSAGEVAVTATNSGTFIVVMGDGNGALSGAGNYRLTLAKTGDPVVVSPGDEGGPMTNGVMHTGTISTGDLDLWTFNANTGDAIVLRVGNATNTSGNFEPWIRLYSPLGKLLGSGFGTSAGEVAVNATNTGTFIVVLGDGNGALSGFGNYRLALAKTGDPVVVSPGEEGGPMTNGVLHTGTISTGDLDLWTFNANSGDAIVLRIGNATNTSGNFTPWIRLYSPLGKLLGSGFGASAGEVAVTATNSGTYLVVAGDGNGALSGFGNYRLTLAKTGDPVVVSSGDEGGPMTNGVMHTGTITTGDLDLWTFSANTGDAIVLRVGNVTNTSANFTPWIRLYSPLGKLLGSGFGASAGEVAVTATNTGTYLVVAGDGNGALSGVGNYRLTLAKTGDPVVVSPGDEGGPMTNGVLHTGIITTGDLDLWTFNANTGDALVLRVGNVTNTSANFTPWIRLYSPLGKLLGSGFGAFAGEVAVTATNTGTYLVVAGDGNGALSGFGNYRLTLAKTGDPVVVSPGDEGGPMTNGYTHLGTILTGDLDLWTITAKAGDALVVRMGEITSTNSFTPSVRLYSPTGMLLSSSSGAAACEVTATAGTTGTYLLVAGDGNSILSGSGDYRLTLAKNGGPIVISAGDEGGAFNGADTYDGTITTGDLDEFYFTACPGDLLMLQMDELVGGSSLTPWLRLYGRDGTLIKSVSGAATALISVTATNAGTFTLLAGDGSGGFSGTGAYRLTVNGLDAELKLCPPAFAGTNANVTGVGGTTNATFILFTQTNIATPLTQWTPLITNQFDQYGVFTRTNVSGRSESVRYFRLLEP